MDLVLALYYGWINFAHKQAIADYKVGRLVTFNWTHSFKVILGIFKAMGCSHNSTIHLVMQEDRVWKEINLHYQTRCYLLNNKTAFKSIHSTWSDNVLHLRYGTNWEKKKKMEGSEKAREGMIFTIDPETSFHLLDLERPHKHTQTQSFTLLEYGSVRHGRGWEWSKRDSH